MHPPRGKVSRSFYAALESWQRTFGTVIKESSQESLRLGLPVGLIASGLVANLILHPLDEIIEDQLTPIY